MITRLSLIAILILIFASSVNAFQARDHLTPQEVDIVKDTQVLDKRIEVFIKAADRRLVALKLTTAEVVKPKQQKKDSELWGEPPTGSPAQLVSDIARIFDEAITNIEDVSARDANNPLIPKALRNLAAAATRIMNQLKPIEAQAKTAEEASTFDQLEENAQAIIQAAGKLPPEVAKKGKAKSEKPAEKN